MCYCAYTLAWIVNQEGCGLLKPYSLNEPEWCLSHYSIEDPVEVVFRETCNSCELIECQGFLEIGFYVIKSLVDAAEIFLNHLPVKSYCFELTNIGKTLSVKFGGNKIRRNIYAAPD